MRILVAVAALVIAAPALADTTVTITIKQSQGTTTPRASGCNWTYPSSCYRPRPRRVDHDHVVVRPKRK